VVVGDVDPLRFLVLIGVDQLICKVLLGVVFAHLDAGPSDYSWVVGARLGLHAKELSKQHLVWLDPQEGFAEVDEEGDVEDSIGVQV
jgi:heme A synthase